VGTPGSRKKSRFASTAGLQDMRLSACWPLLAIILSAASLAAQTSVATGVTAGSAKLTDQRSERALSGCCNGRRPRGSACLPYHHSST